MKKLLRNVLQKIKSFKFKKLLPFVLLGAVASGFIFARPASSTGPEFNVFDNDPKTLRVANSTQATDWQNEINAQNEDVVSFMVYYHNGIEDSTAVNTQIRAQFPTAASENLNINAYLWADNTAKVVEDSVSIKSDQKLSLEYIPGTTKIYRDRSETPADLPDGITQSGVNIDNILGCWDHAGYVVFQAKVKAEIPTQGELAIEKKVANSTREQRTYNWLKQVDAGLGEFVAFNLFVYNQGNADLQNVNVSDVLPAGLTYVPDSTFKTINGENIALADGITQGGLTLENLPYGIENGVYFTLQARVGIDNDTALINTGIAKAGDLNAQDTAKVNILKDHTAIPTIQKDVRNISKNEPNFLDDTHASPGQIVEFRIHLENHGDLDINHLTLTDNLPNGLTYADSANIAPKEVKENQIIWDVPTLPAFGALDITFRAKVGQFGVGEYSLINTAIAANACCDQIEDTAKVIVQIKPAPKTAKYEIKKNVRNKTEKETVWSPNTTAKGGDTLEYLINFGNIGEVSENIKITDNLPQVVNYIAGSGNVKINDKEFAFSTSLFTQNGLSFNLNPGDKGEIYFKVKVNKNIVACSKFQNDVYLIAKSATLKSISTTQIECEQIIEKPENLTPTGLGIILPFSLLFGLVNFGLFKGLSSRLGA